MMNLKTNLDIFKTEKFQKHSAKEQREFLGGFVSRLAFRFDGEQFHFLVKYSECYSEVCEAVTSVTADMVDMAIALEGKIQGNTSGGCQIVSDSCDTIYLK